MAGRQCSCGFTEDASADYAIDDHLFEVFAPDDGKGADGKVHLEGETSLFWVFELNRAQYAVRLRCVIDRGTRRQPERNLVAGDS